MRFRFDTLIGQLSDYRQLAEDRDLQEVARTVTCSITRPSSQQRDQPSRPARFFTNTSCPVYWGNVETTRCIACSRSARETRTWSWISTTTFSFVDGRTETVGIRRCFNVPIHSFQGWCYCQYVVKEQSLGFCRVRTSIVGRRLIRETFQERVKRRCRVFKSLFALGFERAASEIREGRPEVFEKLVDIL